MSVEDGSYYCSEQIPIPPALPDIMKQFTKAAIRTQPKDILTWSYAYFKAMAAGDIPPVKDRLELFTATQRDDTGLTPGLLRTLNKQLSSKRTVRRGLVEEKWKSLSLPVDQFQEFCILGNFVDEFDWLDFFALCASALASDITHALKLICELLTADPDGGPSRIPIELWTRMYRYLAQIDGAIPEDRIQQVIAYLAYDVERQDGMVQPRNFLHKDCPRLQPPITKE